ncbi:hypothetical protein BD410DRAFT_824346 [Rickenella mellea]|uniref:Uncharacterized protein n=1 Tax=Rickenella mellea TaxID=50990 RepID=A0A4Y7QMU7_9AGAM|nr:hypothetical protein BD410DRAFT_824346 [Rickenella mellea]
MSSTVSESTFSFGTRLGLVFIVQAAFLSLISVLALLTYIAYSALKLRKTSARKWSTGTHVHYYFLSMLVSEVVQATGAYLHYGSKCRRKLIGHAMRRRHHEHQVDTRCCTNFLLFLPIPFERRQQDVDAGMFCNAQGILKQIGDVGVALSSLAIAVHTFFVLVFRWRPGPTPRTAIFVLSSIWLFITLSVGINGALNGHRGYWGDTGFWCWITTRYQTQQIVLEYLWMWLTSLLSIVAYVPIALVIKGVIVVEGNKIRLGEKRDKNIGLVVPTHARDPNGLALQMLFYPLIYIITVLPIAIVRWRVFVVGSHSVPPEATVFADVLFSSSGLFNVLLFSATRPSLLPRRESSQFEGEMHAPRRSPITVPPRTADLYDKDQGRADLGQLPDDDDNDIDDEWLSSGRLTTESHVKERHSSSPGTFT